MISAWVTGMVPIPLETLEKHADQMSGSIAPKA
jgi:hypothetical protein